MEWTVIADVVVKKGLYLILDDCIAVMKRILVDYKISWYVLMGTTTGLVNLQGVC